MSPAGNRAAATFGSAAEAIRYVATTLGPTGMGAASTGSRQGAEECLARYVRSGPEADADAALTFLAALRRARRGRRTWLDEQRSRWAVVPGAGRRLLVPFALDVHDAITAGCGSMALPNGFRAPVSRHPERGGAPFGLSTAAAGGAAVGDTTGLAAEGQ